MTEEPLLRFGLVTDAHYSRQATRWDRYYADSRRKLQLTLERLAAHDLDFIVNLGDLIDSDVDLAAEEENVVELRQLLDGASTRVYHLIGNHDVQSFTKAHYLQLLGRDAPYYSFTHNGVHIIALDTNYHADGSDFSCGDFDWREGWVSSHQLTWLRDRLAEAAAAPVVVLSHGSLDDRGEPDPHLVHNAAAVRELLESHGGVRLVLQGHDHRGGHRCIQQIPYITLPALVTGPFAGTAKGAVFTLYADGSFDQREP